MNSSNPLDRAIWFAGGVSKLARELGITHANVCQWKHKQVPYKHRINIEKLTNGQIKATEWEDA